jgi:hypothetical protein
MTGSKVMRSALLPPAYAKRIAHVPGVKAISDWDGMAGWYQTRKNGFAEPILPLGCRMELPAYARTIRTLEWPVDTGL